MQQIELSELVFRPDTVRVTAGSTILWLNTDLVPHNATLLEGSWGFEGIAPGDSVAVVMDEAGVYPYRCTFHPGMEAVVEVLN